VRRMVTLTAVVAVLMAAAGAMAAPIVMTGDPAPGSGGRTFTTNFTDPRINSAGEVAFGARVSGGSNDSVWQTAGGLVIQPALAIENDPAPGGGTYSSLSTSAIRLNDLGHVAYRVRVGGSDGYWSNRTGSVQLIVKEGDPAPGSVPPGNFSNLNASRIYLNNSDHIAFNDSDLDGVWSESTGSIQLVAGAGNPSPPPIGPILNVPMLEYNNNGYCALVGDHDAPILNDNSVFSDRSGSLQKVIGAGDPVPGGGTLTSAMHPVSDIRFNNQNRLALEGWVEQIISSVQTNRVGIFTEDAGGTIRLVAKQTVPLPDGNPAADVALLALDDQGMLFYEGNDSLFVYDTNANTNTLLLAKGAPAPETTSTFSYFNPAVKTNALGQLAFRAHLTDGNDGFWIEQTPGMGDYKLIVLEGQSVEVGPGDFRIVDQIDLNYTQFFNDAGQYAYQVDFFDDTEAIFRGVIPEPATLALLGLGTAALVARRRRSKGT